MEQWSTHAVWTDHVVYCFAHLKTGGNPCRSTSELDSCSHICLLAPRDIEIYQDGYSCHCPPGVQLLYDHRTCNTTGTSWVCWLMLGKLSLFTFLVSWWRFSLSVCSLPPSLLLSVVGISVESNNFLCFSTLLYKVVQKTIVLKCDRVTCSTNS